MPPSNVAIHYVPAGYETKGPKLMGRMAAGEAFLDAYLRHAGVERFYCYAQERKAAGAIRCRGAGPRVDAGRMDPVVQSRRPRQARRALHSGPQPARSCLAPARARSARLQPDRHHPHHGVVRRHGHDRRVRPGAGPGMGRGDLHRQDRAHHGRSPDGRAGGVSEGPPRRPARAAAAIAGHSARRRLRALRARCRVACGAARGTRHRATTTSPSCSSAASASMPRRIPFPMYLALERAAQQTGKRLHLIQAGWFANDFIEDAFRDGARDFCPSVTAHFLDGAHAGGAVPDLAGGATSSPRSPTTSRRPSA